MVLCITDQCRIFTNRWTLFLFSFIVQNTLKGGRFVVLCIKASRPTSDSMYGKKIVLLVYTCMYVRMYIIEETLCSLYHDETRKCYENLVIQTRESI